jgi:CheY-like chemotaxis protein
LQSPTVDKLKVYERTDKSSMLKKGKSVAPYVLIAEFDRQRARMYREVVKAQKLEPCLVHDGNSAERMLQTRGAPALLICDLSLPYVDGFSLIKDLRQLSPPEKSAVVVCSGLAELRATPKPTGRCGNSCPMWRSRSQCRWCCCRWSFVRIGDCWRRQTPRQFEARLPHGCTAEGAHEGRSSQPPRLPSLRPSRMSLRPRSSPRTGDSSGC